MSLNDVLIFILENKTKRCIKPCCINPYSGGRTGTEVISVKQNKGPIILCTVSPPLATDVHVSNCFIQP